jgi:site-specific DNA-adenine methylase
MQPIIKWTGSKRFQAPQIVHRFPKEIDTYYECFLGGGSVLGELMERVVNGTTWNVRRFICIDTNEDLICIWKMIKNFPNKLCDEYENLYNLYNELKKGARIHLSGSGPTIFGLNLTKEEKDYIKNNIPNDAFYYEGYIG